MLEELGANIWTATSPLRFFGAEIGTRMTVIRLPSNGLILISPIQPSDELRAAVDALGEVAYIVGPNRLHHLFIEPWYRQYPRATLLASPGLETKRKDLPWAGTFADGAPTEWDGHVEYRAVDGAKIVSETVFFHVESRTLIVCDLVFNFTKKLTGWTGWLMWLVGGAPGMVQDAIVKLAIRNRGDYADAIADIRAWPFENLVMAHGEVCRQDARQHLEKATNWCKEVRALPK